MFTEPNYELLKRPLDPERVQKREGGGGRTLSYLAGHDVIHTANTIFGIGNWGSTVDQLVCLGEEETQSKSGKSGWRVAYRAVVAVTVVGPNGQTVIHSDGGYGEDVGYSGSKLQQHELAIKEAITDALKRAFKNFDEQFGLSLYSDEGRSELEARARLLNNETELKNRVWRIAKEKLGEEKPTAAAVAQVFGLKKAADLLERENLVRILTEEGVL